MTNPKCGRLAFTLALALPAALCTALTPDRTQAQEQFRTLVSFADTTLGPRTLSPDGRLMLEAIRNELRVYDLASGRRTILAHAEAWDLQWSRAMDRVAWVQSGDDDKGWYVWTMPVDPRTGASRGAAQRVTVGQSVEPSLSPDGQWIAFAAPESDRQQAYAGPLHLVVVPTTGGPERILARFPGGFEDVQWSADGSSVYLVGWGASVPAGLYKIRVSDGHQELLRAEDEWLAGMTSDRLHLVMVPATPRVAPGDSATIIDTSGAVVGRVPLPVGTLINYDGVLGDSALVWMALRERKVIEILPAGGGAPRHLPQIGESNSIPLWSPTGDRLVFRVADGPRQWLAIADADGSHVRRFPDLDVARGIAGAQWSPDARLLSSLTADHHTLQVLNPESGGPDTVLSDPTAWLGGCQWRSDGRSLHCFSWPSERRPYAPRSVVSITLDGARRTLADLSVVANLQDWRFLGDAAVWLRSDSAAFRLSLATGELRRLGSIPSGAQALFGASSRDGRRVVTLYQDPTGEYLDQLAIWDADTAAPRIVDLPFHMYASGLFWPAMLPDDRTFLTFGLAGSDGAESYLYAVPLDGAPPRPLAPVTLGLGSELSASPDGKWIALSVASGPRPSDWLLVDLKPVLRRSGSRPEHP